MQDKEIRKLHRAKIKRMTDSQVGMAVGAAMNQATLLVANKIEPTKENIEKVEEWFDTVYRKAEEKKEYENQQESYKKDETNIKGGQIESEQFNTEEANKRIQIEAQETPEYNPEIKEERGYEENQRK